MEFRQKKLGGTDKFFLEERKEGKNFVENY